MLSVISENSAKQSNPFDPLDNGPNGYNYRSLRHNNLWKQSMAALSSVDAFCSSVYGRKNPMKVSACQESSTDVDGFIETLSQNAISKREDQRAEAAPLSVHENHNKLSDSGPRDDESDVSTSNRRCADKSSRLMRSTSASSLTGDVSIPPSVSPTYILPSSPTIRQTPASEKHSSKDLSQAKTKRNIGKSSFTLRKSSSAMFNSNCQRLPLACGSSTSASCLESSQIISQDDSTRTPQNSHILSTNSNSQQATPEVSYPSLNHAGVSQHKLCSPGLEEGGNQHKLCDVCQQPYTNHKELVLLSPSFLRRTAKTRRTGQRSKKIMPNHKFLYHRRNSTNDSTVSYCSLIRSNFLLAEAIQTWAGRRVKREKNVKDADNDSTEDSSVETETFSESLKAKLYDLLMQIKFQMGSTSPPSAKEKIVTGTDAFSGSNIVRRNYPGDEQKVDSNDDEHLDITDQDVKDADLATGSEANSFQAYSMPKATYENVTQPKATHEKRTHPREYNDSSQTTFEENIADAESMSDRQEMTNTRRNANSDRYIENVYFQDICHKPGKAYIDNRRSRRKGFRDNRSPHMRRSAESPRHQDNFDAKKGTKEEPQRGAPHRKLQRYGQEDWDERRHKFPNKEMNYVPNKNDIEDPPGNIYESVERRDIVMDVEGEKNPETTSRIERSSRKQQRSYYKRDTNVKKYHYKCINIGGRARILQIEHDPNVTCYFENASKVGKTKKNDESVLKDTTVTSEGYLGEQSMVENAEATEPPTADTQKQIDDGDDNIDEEAKYSKVFHKKYSGLEAMKERRIMKRIALERMKARLETTREREGEIGTTRCHPSWPETFVKLMKRRQKHSNKKCIIGKQGPCTDNAEESQDDAAEETQQASAEDTQAGTAEEMQQESAEERQQETSVERQHEAAEIKQHETAEKSHQEAAEIKQHETAEKSHQEAAEIKPHEAAEERQQETAKESAATIEALLEDGPLPYNPPEQSSNFTGLAFLDRFFRVPVPTQMTPERKVEMESSSHSDKLQPFPAVYVPPESQGIQEMSKKTAVDESIKSKQFKDNTRREETDSAAITRVPVSELCPVPVPTLLAPQRNFKSSNPSSTKQFQATRAENSKDSQDASKTSKKIYIKSPDGTDIMHGERTESAAMMQTQATETLQGSIPTLLAPQRKFKIDNPSNTERFQATRTVNSKASQGVSRASEKTEWGEEVTFSYFKDDLRGKQTENQTTMNVPGSEKPPFPLPTHLTPTRNFKIDSPYYAKLKASGAAYFSNVSQDMPMAPKKTAMGENMTALHFKDVMHAEQAGGGTTMQEPGTEVTQEPTQTTSKRHYKEELQLQFQKIKASMEAYMSKASPGVTGEPKKTNMAEVMPSSQLEDNMFGEKNDRDIRRQVRDSALTRATGSETGEDVQTQEREFSDSVGQNVKAGNGEGGNFSASQESLFQQIYSKLLEPVGMKIVDDLEQFKHSNRPLKYRVPASQRLYAPAGSRPVYLSEFLAWLGVRQTDHSSSDDGEEEGEDPYYNSERNKYGRRRQQTFPPNVNVASSMDYFKTQNFDKRGSASLIPPPERSFMSQESQQMYLHGPASEGISAIDAVDTNTTSRLAKETSLALSDRKDFATAGANQVRTDSAATDKPLSPVPESKEIPICESPSKVFHKKYIMKEKLREKQMLRDQRQLPWRKKDRIADEGLTAQDGEGKRSMPTRKVFAKQQERTRQREKWEEELDRLQGKCSRTRYCLKGDSHLEQVLSVDEKDLDDQIFSVDEKDLGDQIEASTTDERPCRVCLSSEEFQERSRGTEGNDVQPSPPHRHAHQKLKSPSKGFVQDVRVLKEGDVEHGADAELRAEQGELQQSASESYSLMDALNQLLQEIPTDVMRKKFLDDMISFADANIPLKFKIPPVSEMIRVKPAAPIYLSQFLSLGKTKPPRSPDNHRGASSSSSDEAHTGVDRNPRPDPLPKYVKRAGSLSHMMSRRSGPQVGTSRRHLYLSALGSDVSLRDLINVSNIQNPDDIGESISYAVSETSEAITESNAPEIAQAEPPAFAAHAPEISHVEPPPIALDAPEISHVEPPPIALDVPEISHVEPAPIALDAPEISHVEPPDIAPEESAEPIESPKPPSKIFHKRFSTEGKCREKDILGTWGKTPLKCRDPPAAKDITPKKNVFSKQAERTLERERQDKEFEREFAEFFGEFLCPSFRARYEASADDNRNDVPGVDGSEANNDVAADVVAADDGAAITADDTTAAAVIADATTGDATVGAIGGATTADDATGGATTADDATGGATTADDATADVAAQDKVKGKQHPAKGNISQELGSGQQERVSPLENADGKASMNAEVQTEVVSDVNAGDIPLGASRLIQGTGENLLGQKFLGDAVAIGVSNSPTARYTIPYSCEMYQPPEARPLYMARKTSDRILSFLGLGQTAAPDGESEPKHYDTQTKSSVNRYDPGQQDDALATSPPWRSDPRNADRFLPEFQSRFMRNELASTSAYHEYERKRFYDYRSFEDRSIFDVSARDYTRTHSPTRGKEKQYDPRQRSPKETEAAQREYTNADFNKYIGFQSQKMKRAESEKAKEHSSQKEDSRRGRTQDLFRWVGKTRTDNFRLQKRLAGDSQYVEDLTQETEGPSQADDVIREEAEETMEEQEEETIYEPDDQVIQGPADYVIPEQEEDRIYEPDDQVIQGPGDYVNPEQEDERIYEPTDDVIQGPGDYVNPEQEDERIYEPADDVIQGPGDYVNPEQEEGRIQEPTQDVILVPRDDVIIEQGDDVSKDDRQQEETDMYRKDAFPQDNIQGAITLKILDEIVAYGQRNIPLKFQARRQQFLEMSAAARPMYISRKYWDQAVDYLGLGGDEEEVEEEEEQSLESETSSSSEEEEPPPVVPKVVPQEEVPVEKKVREEIESSPEEEIPKCVLRGGVVESHRELTFYCPTVPLPRRFRGVIRRHRYEQSYEGTCTGFLRHRSRSHRRIPSYRGEAICYGRTKQLKGRCDIWSQGELDRTSHFSQAGRYYRKDLFRKRLTLRNILRECEKSKEWRQLENSYRMKHSQQDIYSHEKNQYSVDNKMEDYTRDKFKTYSVARIKDDKIPDNDISNSQDCAAHSQRCDFLVSPPRSQGYSYNPDRCSNCGQGRQRDFPNRRLVLDTRPEGQGDYTNHTLTAPRNPCSTGYGYSLATGRNDAEALMHYGKTTNGAHEILRGHSQFKSRAAVLPSFDNTAVPFGKRGTHRSIVASKRRLDGQESRPWGGAVPNWRGCHNNALPATTGSTDIQLGRGSYFAVGAPQVVKILGHQQNVSAYRDVKTQFPYTSNYYSDDGCKLYTLPHASSSLLPTRIY